MLIRTFVIEDYDAVYALWLCCAGMGLNDLDDSREGIEKYLRRNPSTSFVAEEDGRVVGVIMAGHDGRRGYIHHTAVYPDHRCKGIASELVDAAVEALRAEGIHKTALVAFSSNETGNAFWEGKGFTARNDLVYRNLALDELRRIDT